jgi:hypothetical protein
VRLPVAELDSLDAKLRHHSHIPVKPIRDAKKARESWLKFLKPESLRSNLLSASLYLAAYEILRSSFIDQIRSFFLVGWSAESGETIDPRYQTEVLRLAKSPLRASALWLEQNGVIDEHDMAKLDTVREHRNAIAHDLPKFISSIDAHLNVGLFQSICELVTKVDRWWIAEVEIPTNPDYDDREIDCDGIQSGNMIFLRVLVEVATGKPEEAEFYYRKFQEHFTYEA